MSADDSTALEEKISILLTGSFLNYSLPIVRNLSETGADIYCAAPYDYATLHSKHVKKSFLYTPFKKSKENFVDDLASIVRDIKGAEESEKLVIIPVGDEGRIISENRSVFEELGCLLPIPEYTDMQQLFNKAELAEYARRKDIPVPNTLSISEFEKRHTEISYPALIKIPQGKSGKGQIFVNSLKEANEGIDLLKKNYSTEPIIQEFIEGEDYCVSVIANQGEIRGINTYKVILQLPPKTGFGVVAKSEEPSQDHIVEMQNIVGKIMRDIGYNGFAEFDFRYSKEKKVYLLECNTRFPANIDTAMEAGIPFPNMLYDIATTGDCHEETEFREVTKFYNQAFFSKEDYGPLIWRLHNPFYSIKRLGGFLGLRNDLLSE